MKERILVVEDDPAILMGLGDLLESEGYAVERAADGREALSIFARVRPALVLLDIMIPEKSGFDVCREIRRTDTLTPILMLTAKGEEVDKVVGLELGADDYVVKPFGANELLARIRACLRRSRVREETGGAAPEAPGRAEAPLAFGDVTLDPKTLKGRKGGREFPVSPREMKLMRLFAEREGEALDRLTILDLVWGIRYEGTTRTLDQHIAGLRKKIEDNPAEPRFITTVHGVGYRFTSRSS
jgi:DNA-binding response OmpR family regulator